MSKWGEETDAILDVLENGSMPLMENNPEELRRVHAFVDEGKTYRRFWQGMVHGDLRAPPVAQGLTFRESFFQWRDNATALADEHLRIFNEQRERADRIRAVENQMAGEVGVRSERRGRPWIRSWRRSANHCLLRIRRGWTGRRLKVASAPKGENDPSTEGEDSRA